MSPPSFSYTKMVVFSFSFSFHLRPLLLASQHRRAIIIIGVNQWWRLPTAGLGYIIPRTAILLTSHDISDDVTRQLHSRHIRNPPFFSSLIGCSSSAEPCGFFVALSSLQKKRKRIGLQNVDEHIFYWGEPVYLFKLHRKLEESSPLATVSTAKWKCHI